MVSSGDGKGLVDAVPTQYSTLTTKNDFDARFPLLIAEVSSFE